MGEDKITKEKNLIKDSEKTSKTIINAFLTALQQSAPIAAMNRFIYNVLQTDDVKNINVIVDIEFNEDEIMNILGANHHRGAFSFILNGRTINATYFFSNTKDRDGRRISSVIVPNRREANFFESGHYVHYKGRGNREIGHLQMLKADQEFLGKEYTKYVNHHYLLLLKNMIGDHRFGKWAQQQIEKITPNSSSQFTYNKINVKSE